VTFIAGPETTEGHLGALFVSPDRFGSGTGTRLLDAATAALGEAGCTEAIVYTLEDDAGVIGFYEHRGWKPDGDRQTIELDGPRSVVRCRKRLVPSTGVGA
jgi:GNAT superfamily N-acetyltransferase